MSRNRWPHISNEELKALWEKHAPPFLRLENPEQGLPELREVFLSWLESTGIDLGGPAPQTFAKRGRRLRLDGVSLVKRGFEAETSVTLSLNGSEAQVHRAGRALQSEILRLSAETTLDALHQLVPTVGFGIDRAFTIEPAMSLKDAIAVVVVNDTLIRPSQQFVGAAGLSVSEPEAAAKATLDAINRRIERETALPELALS